MKVPKPDKKASKKAIREFLMRVFIVFFMLTGAGVTAYPFVVNALNDSIGKAVINRYQSKENKEFRKKQAKKLKEMNLAEKQKSKALKDPFSQASLDKANFDAFHPNFYAQHTIAVIYIPKISVGLPVFDSTDERFLSQGATWMSDTSFPDGGKGEHSIITAHRGLPTAELFTDLPKLVNGDIFIIKQDDNYLAYEVFEKKTVKPEETGILNLKSDKDLVTLVTCTPYMINTHRLLVTGERVPFTPNMFKEINEIAKAKKNKNIKVYAALSSAVGGVFMLLRFFWVSMQLKRRRYNLRFRVMDSTGKKGLTQAKYQLFGANGKTPLSKNGQLLLASPNRNGEVVFTGLPGGKYIIKQVETPKGYRVLNKVKFKMHSIKDPFFSASIIHRVLNKFNWQQLKGKELVIINPLKNKN
ncbi:MAG: class C sortase [Streptococcaceae bacterium]|nr:class C sortase [Streptococcaceae bacterium]